MLLAALAWWYVHLLALFTSALETLSRPSGFHQLVHLVQCWVDRLLFLVLTFTNHTVMSSLVLESGEICVTTSVKILSRSISGLVRYVGLAVSLRGNSKAAVRAPKMEAFPQTTPDTHSSVQSNGSLDTYWVFILFLSYARYCEDVREKAMKPLCFC